MERFFDIAPPGLKFEYFLCLSVFAVYLIWKVRKRQYLFSPYSIVVLTFAFALFVSGPFQYNDAAWLVLSQSTFVSAFYPHLNFSMAVNLAGFGLVICTMWLVEAKGRVSAAPRSFLRPPDVAIVGYRNALIIGITVFGVCLATVGVIPLLGGRTVFYSHENLRPVYNFANFVILFTSSVLVVWSFVNSSRRFVILIVAALVCMLFTGGRTSLFSVVELIVLLWTYRRFRGRAIVGTGVIGIALAGVTVLGLFLASFRAGSEFHLDRIVESIIYGNTFSDIRDGAYVASAWAQYSNNELLLGKTYLAGLFSFIPSSISDFRTTWSWGNYTTQGLFGYSDHYGFRGGWSLEAFMNFGFVGLIGFALCCGWILGRLETLFGREVVRDFSPNFTPAYATGWLGYIAFTVMIASSATYNLYTLIAVLLFVAVTKQFGQMAMQRFGHLGTVELPRGIGRGIKKT